RERAVWSEVMQARYGAQKWRQRGPAGPDAAVRCEGEMQPGRRHLVRQQRVAGVEVAAFLLDDGDEVAGGVSGRRDHAQARTFGEWDVGVVLDRLDAAGFARFPGEAASFLVGAVDQQQLFGRAMML